MNCAPLVCPRCREVEPGPLVAFLDMMICEPCLVAVEEQGRVLQLMCDTLATPAVAEEHENGDGQ